LLYLASLFVLPDSVPDISFVFAGCKDPELGRVLKELFQTPYFRIVVVPDEETVELCGALKVNLF
jgi:glycerol-3-phosphate dehydrogenase